VKLEYRDFVDSRVKPAIDRIAAIRPAPLGDVSHALVITMRRINAAVEDFIEARKAIGGNYQEDVQQLKVVLFFVPEKADLDSVVVMAGDKTRLRKAIAEPGKRDDGVEIYELNFMPMDTLENVIASDVFESIDKELMHKPTEPVLIDGVWNFVVLQQIEDRAWISEKNADAFKADVEELLDTEVDVEIRVISNEMIARSEEKRTGFAIPTDDRLIAWFMFEVD